MSEEKVSLETLANGGALEKFDLAFQAVLDNIMDPNTLPEAKRSVILRVDIKPTKDRELGTTEISCEPKLAPMKPLLTRLFMGMRGNKASAVESDPSQPNMFPEEKPKALRSIGGGKEE